MKLTDQQPKFDDRVNTIFFGWNNFLLERIQTTFTISCPSPSSPMVSSSWSFLHIHEEGFWKEKKSSMFLINYCLVED